MIQFQDVRYTIGGRVILSGASFLVPEGGRAGLIGPNGCGKTTLLRLILGQLAPESGSIVVPRGRRLGYLAQHPDFEPGEKVFSYVTKDPPHLRETNDLLRSVERRMEEEHDPERLDKLVERYRDLQAERSARGGFEFEGKAVEVLDSLGLPEGLFEREIATLSGGEKNRVALSRILCEDPDILVLDEPTNYLDIEMLEWLEDFLAAAGRTVIFSSHDRAFLNRLALTCIEIRDGQVFAYRGNYDAYARQREEEVSFQVKEYDAQTREIARELEFIRRNFYGQRARQAKSREKRVARLERSLAAPARSSTEGPRISFERVQRGGDDVLRFEGLDCGYPGRTLLSGARMELERGERVALLGPNGSGKTTLLRCLAGELSPLGGDLRRGARTAPALYRQECAADDSPLPLFEEVHDIVPKWDDQRVRDLLAAFLFRGDRIRTPVKDLSGGEKAKLALIRLVLSGANLLLLDEPTNHLDIHSRAAIEEGLSDFPETIVFVSHDRYFIERMADRILSIEGGELHSVMGSFADYRERLRLRRQAEALDRRRGREADRRRREEEKRASEKPRPRRKVDEEKLMGEITKLEGDLESLQKQASLPEVCRSSEASRRVKGEIDDLRERIAQLFRRWEGNA